MFAAAMLYSCPNLEMSIYSTCKRISQKLLRNVQKFLEIIYMELGTARMREVRVNMEEIVVQGHEGPMDVRMVNSYPSKVLIGSPAFSRMNFQCSWRRVSFWQRSVSLEHLAKWPTSTRSAASCSASAASFWYRMPGLTLSLISCTSRRNAMRGMHSSGSLRLAGGFRDIGIAGRGAWVAMRARPRLPARASRQSRVFFSFVMR